MSQGKLRDLVGPSSAVARLLPSGLVDFGLAVRRRVPASLRDPLEERAGLRDMSPPRPSVPDDDVKLWVGPANYAGQGYRWAKAASHFLQGVGARDMAIEGGFRFPTDYLVPRAAYASSAWAAEQEQHLAANYSHVLIEAERPVTGLRYGISCAGELPILRQHGLNVALISHGSDIRRPLQHAERHDFSPFREKPSAWRQAQRTAERNLAILERFEGPVYVSTPDLLDEFPRARWCPVVVDMAAWSEPPTRMERDRPVVVHVPSLDKLKGTDLIDPILQRLDAEGLIEYRSLRGLSREEVRANYADADVVAEQFTMGLYGVAAVEAMALGRVVLGYAEPVRERVRNSTGHELPIVEATPATLELVVRDLVRDRAAARVVAAQGQAFAHLVHDGRLSADVLGGWLLG